MAQIQQFVGGAAGLGGTLSARQFLDDPGQNRFLQPSVLYGVGTGVLAGALWFTDIDTPVIADEFWAAHAMTALPAGLFYGVFPKTAGKTTTEQFMEAFRSNSPVQSRERSGNTNGTAGGNGGAETERASVRVESGGTGRNR